MKSGVNEGLVVDNKQYKTKLDPLDIDWKLHTKNFDRIYFPGKI